MADFTALIDYLNIHGDIMTKMQKHVSIDCTSQTWSKGTTVCRAA